eukprot:gb/GECH01010272.1/.p1 GENE.gb/GECH01010272.1/~~gb/GECH01010272.1/.p1  ORF type:complete len:488 (+),score=158.35 gb/GECH01010272.1/:1-1464(+)
MRATRVVRKNLSVNSLNENVLGAQYAVRGKIVLRANEIEKQLGDPKTNPFPFKDLVYCNIGNPQALRQRPITFFREVLSLVVAPHLLNKEGVLSEVKEDVIERARTILDSIPGNSGAYSHSMGLESVRKNVARFIETRDQQPANPNHIFLTDGASPGIQSTLNAMIRSKNDGILIPRPQYPLYSASISLLGGSGIPYYLNEEKGWALDVKELDRAYEESQKKGINIRALVVINPGNPTGTCLSRDNMEEIVDFCHSKNLVLMSDEVYQDNVYQNEKPFYSFKKIVTEMGSKYSDQELFSYHSISKGFLGECGRRGGYFEMHGIDQEVRDQMYKLASIGLCPNIDGQIMVDLKVAPPEEGDPSHNEYIAERDAILSSLKKRAQQVSNRLGSLEGMECKNPEGAMYAFPRVDIPKKAVEAAHQQGVEPDFLYCMEMLEQAGVCVVPGSGFGQREGTYHFRTTFLPPEEQISAVTDRVEKFHNNFLQKYQ